MLIKNFGLFWNRDEVWWGSHGNAGTLMGRMASEKSRIVDFRYQSGIYCLYDPSFQLVYAGQAGRQKSHLLYRLRQHQTDHLSARWTMFSWFGTIAVDTSQEEPALEEKEKSNDVETTRLEVLDHMEAILIHAAEPPLNRQGGRFGKDVEQYLQVPLAEDI